MTGETRNSISGWTVDTYAVHNEALREARKDFDAERDRRYAEVGIEKEKALKIKEAADLAALELSRDSQTYKDEQANRLREQIAQERGTYATKDDLIAAVEKIDVALQPVINFVAGQQGRGSVTSILWSVVTSVAVAVIVTFIATQVVNK